MTRTMAIGLLTLAVPAALLAAHPGRAADPDPDRFQLERSGDHFVRLDRQTGAMSLCVEKDGNLVCRMAADERAAYDTELDRLSGRVDALEKAVASGSPASRLPSDAEVDRTIGIMERMMRSFMGLAKQFRDEDADKALPQKTGTLYE